ncbi:hypothetical protein [Variovorax paradoxus]|uniref:hypothetical protein n=1 Tax=Variovorax paradoxus TaxID=34073 RepID=UPI0012BBFAF5|nr:hypothetical protein [Variovorax paradoxus]
MQNEPTRPPHKFPHGSIKQKTSAVATVRDFLGVRHAEHREIEPDREVNSARSEFGGDHRMGTRVAPLRGNAAKNNLLSQREHH